jgi:putative exporter of polyketide antibiotics
MTIFQYISYGILVLIALYLTYIIVISLVGLIWSVIKILWLSLLIGIIIWWLHKQGFFDKF